MRFATLLALLLAVAPAQEPTKVTVTGEIYSSDAWIFVGDEPWLCLRVVDGISGEPIASAELSGVDPVSGIRDIYLEHPDLDLGYFDSFTWYPGEPPVRLHAKPGTSSTGKVIDPDGAPVSGAYVGCQNGPHRGPWTRTTEEGTFALHGSDGPWGLVVDHGDRVVYFDRPREQPFTLQLPEPSGERKQFVRLPPEETTPDPEQGPARPRRRRRGHHAGGGDEGFQRPQLRSALRPRRRRAMGPRPAGRRTAARRP